jgi:hypothetical protein
MKDGIPTIYWVFRWVWSILHLLILAALATSFFLWAFTDHQGADAFAAWLSWINNLRYVLSHLLAYPWEP